MRSLSEALAWRAGRTTVSLFVVVAKGVRPSLTMAGAGVRPLKVDRLLLEPPDTRGSSEILAYDAEIGSPLVDVASYVASCLDEAISTGGLAAWFGFEGSFHFDHLLTADVSNLVYGVADSEGIAVAEDLDDLRSNRWCRRVVAAQRALPRDLWLP